MFDETFGIWPDNMVVFKDCKFIWRGVVNLDGSRDKYHSKSLEDQLDKFKYWIYYDINHSHDFY